MQDKALHWEGEEISVGILYFNWLAEDVEDSVAALALADFLNSAEALDDALALAIGGANYQPFNASGRVTTAVSAASVAWEHARAARLLVSARLFTTALAVMRLQHEALTRSIWLTYVATDSDVGKLSVPLSKETENAASKLPMMAEMLKQLADEPKAAKALMGLQAFKMHNAPALNSFVHGGIHALQRQTTGYPVTFVHGVLRNSNGLLLMTAMSLAVLSGQQPQVKRVGQLQLDAAFSGVLPERSPATSVKE